MAHSNRQKLRDARGGKTRNQARKAQQQSNSSSSDRMANTLKWMADNEEKRKQAAEGKGAPKTEAKTVRYEKSENATIRRKSALLRKEADVKRGYKMIDPKKHKELPEEEWLVFDKQDKDKKAIGIIYSDKELSTLKKEILTLKSRI